MPITVREMWQLEEFRVFRLVAGEKGLDNKICNVGILDYEYATEDKVSENSGRLQKMLLLFPVFYSRKMHLKKFWMP